MFLGTSLSSRRLNAKPSSSLRYIMITSIGLYQGVSSCICCHAGRSLMAWKSALSLKWLNCARRVSGFTARV